jgi:predicted secreted hydrolase
MLFSFTFAEQFKKVSPKDKVHLPEDMYFKKDYRVQWWYFTGHLWNEKKEEFGYELTFFTVNVNKRNFKSKFGLKTIYITHFAVTDVKNKKFYFSDRADRGAFGYAGADTDSLKVWIGKTKLTGSLKEIRINGISENKKINLKLIPEKPYILNGIEGYSRKTEEDPLDASLYFSNPRLKTEGTLILKGKKFKVKGYTWFDREIFSHYKKKGWDWFAVQLDDRREFMIYLIRDKNGNIDKYSSGTFIYKDGSYRALNLKDFKVKNLEFFHSKKTGAKYPSKWKITIPSEKIDVVITPLVDNQEVVAYYTTGNYYWEGTCKVEGSQTGRAYVEMTGY